MDAITEEIASVKYVKKLKKCSVKLESGAEHFFNRDIVLKYNLSKGRRLSQEEINAANHDQALMEAKQAAFKYASYKPRTEKLVSDTLKRKGFKEPEISISIDFLKEFKLINDKEYSEKFALDCANVKNYGPARIVAEMLKRGINKSDAKEAVEKSLSDIDFEKSACEAGLKKYLSLKSRPEEKRKNSTYNYLIRQGFNHDDAKMALKRIEEKKQAGL